MDLQPWVDSNREKFDALVPADVTGGRERFLRNMVFQVGANPSLRDCTKQSIIESCLQATLLQLDIGVLGQCYLVPFKTKHGTKLCTMIPGYRGLLTLARRSGRLRAVHCEVVCANDSYERTQDSFAHNWDPFGDRGEMIGVYAIFVMDDGSEQIETMSRTEVEAIRARSKAGHSGPWVTDFGEMAKKTVLRRGIKKLDLRVESLERAIQADNEQYEDAEVSIRSNNKGASALAETLRALPENVHVDISASGEVEEPNGHEEVPPAPAPPKVDPWPWDAIREGCAAISRNLGLPVWTKLSEARRKVIQRRAREEGWEPKEVVTRLQDVLLGCPKSYFGDWPTANQTLDVLVRVPQQGNPDHFQRITEMGNQQPEEDPDAEAAAALFGDPV